MNKIKQALFATALAALALPAFAQDVIGTLSVNQGTVQASNSDGQFVTASSGQSLQAGQQITIGQNSSATVTFTNGSTVVYSTPGTYTLSMPVAATGTSTATGTGAGASAAATVGIIAGATALGALGVEQAGSGESVPPDQPVSR